MSKRTIYFNAAVFGSISALLGACGGGGGGGGGGDGVTTSSAPVTISAANAEEVAAASYKTTSGLEGGGSGATSVIPAAVTQTDPNINLVDVLLSQLRAAPQRVSANAAGSLIGAVVTETMDCFNGGSMSITFDDADNNQQLSTGDSMSFNANLCSEEGMTMNGSVTMNIVSAIGHSETDLPYSMQLSIQASNFTVMEGAESFALNGGMTLSESTNDGVSFTNSLTGSSIQVTEGGVNASLYNFSIEASEDNSILPYAYTLDLNATVDSAELGGSVTIVTDIVFAGSGLDNPSSGQATITGANNSSVTLIALDSVNVRLEVDADGNGSVETIDTTWDAL